MRIRRILLGVCCALVVAIWISDIFGTTLLSLCLAAVGAAVAATGILIEIGEGRR